MDIPEPVEGQREVLDGVTYVGLRCTGRCGRVYLVATAALDSMSPELARTFRFLCANDQIGSPPWTAARFFND